MKAMKMLKKGAAAKKPGDDDEIDEATMKVSWHRF